MKMAHLQRLAMAAAATISLAALAQGDPNDSGVPIVCSADGQVDTRPPDFTDPECETGSGIDPQGRMIWVKTAVRVPQSLLEEDTPLGLFVLAKASSEIYLNGVLIGQNGVPAKTRDEEVIGLMDAVVEAPRDLLRVGENEVVLRMSSHNGYLRLSSPVHAIMVARFGTPQQYGLQSRWPALVAFGALLVGACYFAAISIRGAGRRNAVLLTIMSAAAAGQLFSEISRALFAYPYPVHDLRLILILCLASVIGICLAAYLIWTFIERRRITLLLSLAVVMAIFALLLPGFDAKTLYVIVIPVVAGCVVTALAARRGVRHALPHLVALFATGVLMTVAPILFLDLLLYYIVAALLVFLFVQQAYMYEEERRLRQLASDRANRLEFALEQAQAPQRVTTISVSRSGQIERISSDQIVGCNAAGDYVELFLVDGRRVLHDASMNELEETLPPTFLRVHRSHIVNSAYARKLKRRRSGVGVLYLSDGSEVPVSRRIMPSVRTAFD